jgi:hypothetical protein
VFCFKGIVSSLRPTVESDISYGRHPKNRVYTDQIYK